MSAVTYDSGVDAQRPSLPDSMASEEAVDYLADHPELYEQYQQEQEKRERYGEAQFLKEYAGIEVVTETAEEVATGSSLWSWLLDI